MRNIIRKDNKMARYRQGRINGEITREMTSIVRDVKDPRVSDAMICITGADCSADLKFCKIYYSTLLTGGRCQGGRARTAQRLRLDPRAAGKASKYAKYTRAYLCPRYLGRAGRAYSWDSK